MSTRNRRIISNAEAEPSNIRDGLTSSETDDSGSHPEQNTDLQHVQQPPPENAIPENVHAKNDNDRYAEVNTTQLMVREIRKALIEMLPPIVAEIKEDMGSMMDQKLSVLWATKETTTATQVVVPTPRAAREVSYRDFSACDAPKFHGVLDPVKCAEWIEDVEGAFLISKCAEDCKVVFASNLLRGAAKRWWTQLRKEKKEAIATLTWEEFTKLFTDQYAPKVERERILDEFLKMEQTTETVNEITTLSYEKLLYCPSYMNDEDLQMHRYSQVLRENIREVVSSGRHSTLEQMVEAARKREMFLESKAKKRASDQAAAGAAKKFKSGGNTKPNERKDAVRCPKCGKGHTGECRMGTKTCYRCGKSGHLGRDCQTHVSVCFKCGQPGHRMANCTNTGNNDTKPSWQNALKIYDGGKKNEVPRAKGRAYQMTVEEAKAEPRVIEGTYIVNSLPALVLFLILVLVNLLYLTPFVRTL